MAIKKAKQGTTVFPERRTPQQVRDAERIMNASRPPKSKLDKNGLYPIGSKEEKARRGGDEFDFKPKSSSAPKKKMGGAVKKKVNDGGAFAKLAPPYNKATYADKIAGATKGKAKMGKSIKKKSC